MKTPDIIRTLRNATTPAARLAAWQALPLFRRLSEVKAAGIKARLSLREYYGPELSAPEADTPQLWFDSLGDSEILETWQGRDFLAHCGWYTDDDELQDETVEAYAVRLARFPRLIFEATFASCGGSLRVDLSSFEEIDYSDCESDYDADQAREDCAREVVRSADSTAKRMAEDEREYRRKWRIENDIEENKETLKSLRPEIRALAHELSQPGNRANPEAPLVRAACKNLRALLRDRRDLMAENSKLAASL